MKTVTPREAVAAMNGQGSILSAPGCGTPVTVLAALGEHAEELDKPELYSGLLLCDYPFLDAVHAGKLRYGTWHVMPPVRRMVADGSVPFFPVRGSQVPALVRHLGVGVVVIRASPPDRFGFCSMGPSVSYPYLALGHARLVVAEIDPELPRTRGQGAIHVDDIDLAIESGVPTPLYERSAPDDVSRKIAEHIIPLLPEAPTLQIGIGAIPEALLEGLRVHGVGELRFAGMATDGMVDLHEAGLLERRNLFPYPPILAAELMGTRRLLDFAHENPMLGVYSTQIGITATSLSQIDRFVSIQSAIEIDALGQVNSEWVPGVGQLTGAGGSVDFLEAALHSEGGVRILAMPASNVRDASPKIVATLGDGAPVTIGRHSVDHVVTEHGVASLGFLPADERVRALVAIAAPKDRAAMLGDQLAA
jgi:4-hydroxybutyrate CoA-transferase